ncbi:30S ribosomal protein S8 [Candidatus Microgenomates bacterium]|nr:MAG: 30S ribosomal protein S8 [Candidatus Microgenomates bacterium]
MITDPIADMLIRIKNGYLAGKKTVDVPYSRVKESLAKLLQKYEYIGTVASEKDAKQLKVTLMYPQGKPAMSEVVRLSKPGLRRYSGVSDLEKIKQGLGFTIVSTPKGLMTHQDAKKQRLGGELICRVW